MEMMSMMMGMQMAQMMQSQMQGGGWGKGKGKGKGGGGWNNSWEDTDWNEGGSKKKRKAAQWEPERDHPKERRGLFSWITSGDDAKLALKGLPVEGAVCRWEKDNEVFAWALHSLKQITENVYEEVETVDDEDLSEYPEVAKAVKEAGFLPTPQLVAYSQKYNRWGVGLGHALKERERGAYLALAIAIATANGDMPKMLRRVPDVSHFTSAENCFVLPQGRKWKPDGEGMEEPMPDDNTDEMTKGKVTLPGCYPVVGLDLTGAPPGWMISKELPMTCPAVYFDKKWLDVYSSSGWILDEVTQEEYTIEDDVENTIYPEILQAVKSAGGEEDSIALIFCPGLKKWAVGVAAGKKNREKAAKLALAFAIIKDKETHKKFASQMDDYGMLVSAAGLLPPELSSSRKRYKRNNTW